MPLPRSQKFPIISLIVCLIAVAILCALGIWQVERLQWKNNLQQNLDAAFSDINPAPFTAGQFQDIGSGQVIRGTAKGQMDLSKAVLFHGRILDGKVAMAVIAPLDIPSLGIVVPVEVGCAVQPNAKNLQRLKTVSVTATGILRQPRWSFATPANIPDQGEWWRVDSKELGAHWEIPNLKNTVLTAENTTDFSAELEACPIEKKLKNDHASYAFFWFTMAGVLSVIWGIRFLKPYLQSA